jgi:hypothetical protein
MFGAVRNQSILRHTVRRPASQGRGDLTVGILVFAAITALVLQLFGSR